MADAATIEADLLAALGVTAPLSLEPTPAAVEPVKEFHGLPTSSASYFNSKSLSTPAIPDPPLFLFASTTSSHQPLPSPDAKRRLDSDPFREEESAKRPKTEHELPADLKHEGDHGPQGLDLEAALQNALASFDEQSHHPVSNPVALAVSVPEPPDARSPTVSPGPDKVEERIMKASRSSTHMIRSMSLPLLGNLAVQILLRLSQQSRLVTELLLADHESEFRRDYDSLTSMFLPARRIFSTSPLFFPDDLDITDSDDRETIRMSNLASIAASLFSANDVSLADVHKSFFSIFVPEDGGYRSSLTDLLVDLKTQVFIDELWESEEAQHVTALVDELFPLSFDESLRQRSGNVLLNSAETMLATRVRERRDIFINVVNDPRVKSQMRSQYSSGQFADDLSAFLRSHLSMVVEYADKYGVNIPLSQEDSGQAHIDHEHFDLASLLQSATSNLVQAEELKETGTDQFMADMPNLEDGMDLSKLIEQSLSDHKSEIKQEPLSQPPSNNPSESVVSKDLASLISEKLADSLAKLPNGLSGLPTSYPDSGNDVLHTGHPPFSHQVNQLSSSYHPYTAPSAPAQATGANGGQLPPNQSSPTSVLYERARQAAVAKSSNTARREGLHSTRRPWTPEEEKALMAGLDMVKGPHWSQILSLFGANGSISDILKDRTQVQLKDKARNLKLFFLKTNSEMPFYLQSVTGELKTRAPSQAARKEAEEKARLNQEEEQARLQGIMMLAGGLQSNHHNGANTTIASTSTRASPMTSTTVSSTAAQIPTTTAPARPVPIPPLVKPEVQDNHPLQQLGKLPQIQPAPSSTSTSTAAAAPAPIAQMQSPLKPQSSPRRPYQAPSHQIAQPLPANTSPRPQVQAQMQVHAQAPAQVQTQAQTQVQAQHPNGGIQNYGLPPLPPNHHSTPDQAQDDNLFETLKAALAASNNESHMAPVAAETSAN